MTYKYIFDCNKNGWVINTNKSIKNNGFVILRNFLPIKFVKSLHIKTLDLYRKNKISNKLRDIHQFKDGTLSSIHNIFDYLPFYKNVLKLENVKKVSASIFDNNYQLKLNSSYFAKPPKVGLATKPHQDNAFFCMKPAEVLTFWFPTEFSAKHNGPLYYYPETNKKNYLHRPLGNLGTSMTINKNALDKIKKNKKAVYVEANIGDCVIHDALVVHGSDQNISKDSRNAFNFSLFSDLSVQNKILYKNYKNNLKKYLDNKKKNI